MVIVHARTPTSLVIPTIRPRDPPRLSSINRNIIINTTNSFFLGFDLPFLASAPLSLFPTVVRSQHLKTQQSTQELLYSIDLPFTRLSIIQPVQPKILLPKTPTNNNNNNNLLSHQPSQLPTTANMPVHFETSTRFHPESSAHAHPSASRKRSESIRNRAPTPAPIGRRSSSASTASNASTSSRVSAAGLTMTPLRR